VGLLGRIEEALREFLAELVEGLVAGKWSGGPAGVTATAAFFGGVAEISGGPAGAHGSSLKLSEENGAIGIARREVCAATGGTGGRAARRGSGAVALAFFGFALGFRGLELADQFLFVIGVGRRMRIGRVEGHRADGR